jgi:UDP-galactopyranose mutase
MSGCVLAERISSRGAKVLVVEKRSHIGGNCYDKFDGKNNYIQMYGPHVFHTNRAEVWNYINMFTEFNNYSHEVSCNIGGEFINIPFNFNSIDSVFEAVEAQKIKKHLKKEFGEGNKISILNLRRCDEPSIQKLSKYVYEKIFLNYTLKQWGRKPEGMFSSVSARVPVVLSEDNRYFHDRWQGVPKEGFTAMFEKMLDNPCIDILMSSDYKDVAPKHKYAKLFYTGPLDYFFGYKYGRIEYRRIKLRFENYSVASFQRNSVVNYPNEYDYTRITEFNKFLFVQNDTTIIAKEYSSPKSGFMGYPVQTSYNQTVINKYLREAEKLKDLYFIGRLAECRYYNMDQCIENALNSAKELEL